MRIFIKALLPLFLLCSFSVCSADEIYSKNQKANELYKQGKYDEALKLYEDALLLSPSDEKLKMNHGSTLYRLGDYDKAEESYNGALSVKDRKIRSDAHYNMGNILYKKAEQIQYQDLQGAQEKLKSALQHYIESLDLSPENIDAKWNLQLTHQKIRQLEQQQQQNQQNQDNKDDKNNQNKNDQQQNNQQKEDQQKQQDNKEEQKDKNQQQQQQQQQSEMKESEEQQKEMKKEDARRLLELYADDADSLNKPMNKKVKTRQPEQDW